MSRKMATLDDLRKKGGPSADDDSDDEGPRPGNRGGPVSSYVGSGQAVLGPGGGRGGGNGSGSGKGIMDSIMGQQGVGDGTARGQVVIKFWKNGFTVDDGPLRTPEDPANKEFLDSINKGVVPMELRERHRALQAQGGLDVSVEDHRAEDFVEPAYRAFSGAGASLGRSAPAPPSAAVVGKAAGGKAAVVDEGKPTTTLQVKLANGKREKIVLNLTHTVADLQNAVAALGATGGKPFTLSAGFPPKPLADPSMTIEAAGLKNAAVTQVVV